MAKIGMQYVWYRKYNTVLNEDGTENTTLGEKKKMGGAISADLTINTTEAKLYYDDGLGEYANEFVDGSITTVVDDMEDSAEEDLFGATKEENGDIVNKSTDTPPWIQQAFVLTRIKAGVTKYRGYALTKVKYGTPSDSQSTKGETITFGTTTVTGTITKDENDVWRRRSKWMDKIEDARAWVDTFMTTAGA